MTGIEPVTSSLPRKCSTAELHRHLRAEEGHPEPQGNRIKYILIICSTKERKTGLKPATLSLEG